MPAVLVIVAKELRKSGKIELEFCGYNPGELKRMAGIVSGIPTTKEVQKIAALAHGLRIYIKRINQRAAISNGIIFPEAAEVEEVCGKQAVDRTMPHDGVLDISPLVTTGS